MAESLAARSDAVADRLEAGDECAARAEAEALQAATIAAVNDRRVPRRYQEELLGSVNALVESIECVPPPAPAAPSGDGHEDGDEDERGGKKKGKKKKKDEEDD